MEDALDGLVGVEDAAVDVRGEGDHDVGPFLYHGLVHAHALYVFYQVLKVLLPATVGSLGVDTRASLPPLDLLMGCQARQVLAWRPILIVDGLLVWGGWVDGWVAARGQDSSCKCIPPYL